MSAALFSLSFFCIFLSTSPLACIAVCYVKRWLGLAVFKVSSDRERPLIFKKRETLLSFCDFWAEDKSVCPFLIILVKVLNPGAAKLLCEGHM